MCLFVYIISRTVFNKINKFSTYIILYDWCAIRSIWELLSLLYRDHNSYALLEYQFFDIPVELG